MRQRACRWHCGRLTDRVCGICLQCCNERDEKDGQIDAGMLAYLLADQRPGHRFYKGPNVKRQMTEAQKQSLAQARAAKSLKQIAGAPPNSTSEGQSLG